METNDSPQTQSKLLMVGVLSMFVLLVAGAWLILRGVQNDARTGAQELKRYGAVPNTTLTERSGQQIALDQLKGKIWVADFIFTRCNGTCQMMSLKMADLQKSLVKADDVKLVSISVDPKNDTPERLAKYASTYNADKEKWLFLTGQDAQIQSLAKDGFHLGIAEGKDPAEPIIHSTRFVLVDKEGQIRGYYDSAEPESQQRLLTDIGVLAREEG